ncbi:MAG TPA: twin-arginine translocase subunit TatA [Gammaproteobacteria bacterium]|nr:twin-arginine translocase subunit TatA [Gammaproteobacteria bacterium]
MGVGGIGIWQLVIVLVIVLLLFGGKKLRNLGGDLGAGIRGFKKSMNDEANAKPESLEQKPSGEVIDAEVTEDHKDKV